MGLFVMPSLGADMDAGKLVEWLVSPGDSVTRGDVVAVVETQKGAIEIECFEDGTVHDLQAELGAELPVGAPLALILGPGEAAPTVQAGPQTAQVDPVTSPPARPVRPEAAMPTVSRAPSVGTTGHVLASPAARVRAKELGLNLSRLTGTGPGGAILLADVDAPAPKPEKPSSPMDEMRRAIAAAMTRAKQTIPHFYLSQTMDVEPAITWLAERNADRPPAERLLLGALVVRAAVKAAEKISVMNGHFTDGHFNPAKQVNAGVAVALRGGGLVAPALLDAGAMDLDRTMEGMRDLVTRARAGRLRSSEMTEGTLTISSLGDTGAEAMSGIIFPPQVALVGVGAPQRRPWIVGNAIVPRSVLTVTLSADHRVSDGRQAARFLAAFESHIASPETL